ncbi:hypothetical protein HBI14_008180 [Parastagonospora nodorum]|nr:hypothetical protein HBI14_008180 [Parastagonospora nodorum]
MSQTNVREGYRITTLEVVELIENLISYYSAKVKIEDLSNMLTLTLSKTAQQRSLSVVSNRSTALITDKFGVALLTKPAILNDANVALVDAVHHSVQKLEKNYFKVRAQHLKYNVIDALMITLIKDDDDLLGTINSHIKLRRLRARYKTKAADSRYAKASRGRTKKDKDSEDSDTSSNVLRLRRRDRAAAYSLLDSDDYCLDSSLDINPKDDLEDEEAIIAKNLLIDAYILYFKELLSNNSRIFINAIGIGKTRAIVLAVLIEHFCFFSNSPSENIGRLTKEEVIEMQINTTNAISKALAAANKLIILEANTPAMHSKATKHYSALLAVQFIIVCGFGKIDKHVFRAYNTISVTAQRTIIRKGSSYIEKRAILLPSYITFNATDKRDSVTSNRIYKIEDAFKTYSSCKVKRFTLNSVKDLFTNLSKDYFLVREARAITKSSLKFQNLSNLCSKSITAEDAAKAANTLLLLKEVCAKILIGSYKLIKFSDESVLVMQRGITQHEINLKLLAEMCVSIVYFNLDSELELKVLGKQDVKTTS